MGNGRFLELILRILRNLDEEQVKRLITTLIQVAAPRIPDEFIEIIVDFVYEFIAGLGDEQFEAILAAYTAKADEPK